MASGPAPTPTAILKARGSWRGDKRGDEPTLEVGAPPCPPSLKGDARKEWGRACRILQTMRVVTEADLATLEPYCRLFAEYRDLQRRCDKMLKDTPGEFPNYPQVFALRNSALDRMTKYAEKLGFSPADRARLKAAAPDKKEGKAEKFGFGKTA